MRFRRLMAGAGLAAIALLLGSGSVPRAFGSDGSESRTTLTAFLDGVAIPLDDVADYYCDDFAYPKISCSRSPLVAAARSSVLSLLTAVDYVTVYDYAAYSGSFMYMSQDYSVLALIGWSDRIGSFIGRNSETGMFHTDWFNGGTGWSFCCNQQVGGLGAYNNTFSSVERT